jgi:hypothetical protein
MDLRRFAFWSLIAVIAVAASLYVRRRDAREQAGLAPGIDVTVRVPTWLYRAAQRPLFYAPVSLLTGVSVTFCPLYLFLLGGGSVDRLSDWRVIACLLIAYIVPLLYMMMAGPVFRHAWRHRKSQGRSA